MIEFQKEIVDKIEEAIRLGFQIAKDYAEPDYTHNNYNNDNYYVDFTLAKIKLNKRIEEMRKAALGQEAA